METPNVRLELTRDEALVLFEWLSRANEGDDIEPLIYHWSEQMVLSTVLASLEKTLVEPFDAKYAELLTAARERLVADVAQSDRRRMR
jgi:hypothetical protein